MDFFSVKFLGTIHASHFSGLCSFEQSAHENGPRAPSYERGWPGWPGALSIQQKFRFEILEIRVPNGTAHSRCTDLTQATARLVICSCKHDTKERCWGQQFCQVKREISGWPTEMTRPVKVDDLQSWSRIFWSDQTEMVRSVRCTDQNFRNFGLNGKRPRGPRSRLYSKSFVKFSMCSYERAGWLSSRELGFSNRDLGKRAENFAIRTLHPVNGMNSGGPNGIVLRHCLM